MKTEFLKGLGIEDQSVIDKIMAENGKDINNAKKDYETLEQENAHLKEQVSERDTQLKDLKKTAGDNEELTNKITQLQEDNKATQKAYDDKIAELQKSHAIESAVRDAKAKNAKAVIALLNQEQIKYVDGQLVGISEQLKALSEGEDTSFLFVGTTPNNPSGTKPGENVNNSSSQNNPSANRELGGLNLAAGIASAMAKKG